MSFTEEGDEVFRALADSTRRKILDFLRKAPLTTGDICEKFPELSRFGVMKHLAVLEKANLTVTRREGRVRWNHINAVPFLKIYERWIGRFAGPLAASLLRFQETVEKK